MGVEKIESFYERMEKDRVRREAEKRELLKNLPID